MKLIFATHNSNKAFEIQKLLPEQFQILTLDDLNFFDEIPENEPTIEGNSAFKAQFIFKKFNLNCFADDTGLEIEALKGRPGVHSARYAGEEKNADENMNLVLNELNQVSNRRARFKTLITLIIDGKQHIFEGIVNGRIILEKRGSNGFGYDPIFIPENETKTFAEMGLSEKNKFSHRARALEKMKAFLSGEMQI
jgi:XTP/dITP diphosphohydrolase